MTLLILGLVLFLGIHSVQMLGNGPKSAVVERIGKAGWLAGYSLLSLLGLYLIITGYVTARENPTLVYETSSAAAPISHILMAIAMILLVATYLPIGNIKRAVGGHPMLTAIILWAGAHLLLNGTRADVALFGSFLVWAIINRVSHVFRSGIARTAKAPNVLNDIAAIIMGIAAYIAAIAGVHEWLIGVAPIS